jgi:hypothetical protein
MMTSTSRVGSNRLPDGENHGPSQEDNLSHAPIHMRSNSKMRQRINMIRIGRQLEGPGRPRTDTLPIRPDMGKPPNGGQARLGSTGRRLRRLAELQKLRTVTMTISTSPADSQPQRFHRRDSVTPRLRPTSKRNRMSPRLPGAAEPGVRARPGQGHQ